MARRLFPLEARLAMQIAHADSTSEFAGRSNLDEISSEQIRSLQKRLQALEKTGNPVIWLIGENIRTEV